MDELKDLKEHITRVEESQTFTDRTVEDLNKQVLDIYHKLEQLSGRVKILEESLRDSRTSPAGPEPDQTKP